MINVKFWSGGAVYQKLRLHIPKHTKGDRQGDCPPPTLKAALDPTGMALDWDRASCGFWCDELDRTP